MSLAQIAHNCQCPTCQLQIDPDAPEKLLHQQFNLLLSRMDEQSRRRFAALEANRLGFGGIRLVSLITGLDEKTIAKGQAELETKLSERPAKGEGLRLPGGGRKPSKKTPETVKTLEQLVVPYTAGDPQVLK
jgi:hypothetical protein